MYIPSGICTKCGERTDVGNSCCGAPVEFEGHLWTDEDAQRLFTERKAAMYADKVKDIYADVSAAWAIAYDAYITGALEKED